MSKKHPGRDTEFAKWESFMAKLDYQMKKEEEERKAALADSPKKKSKKKEK